MRFISILLLLQVLMLSAAPALDMVLPELSCCAASCDEVESSDAGHEQDHQESAEDPCNPFSCTGCCLLVLSAEPMHAASRQLAEATAKRGSLVPNPPLQPQYGIWHPPRQG